MPPATYYQAPTRQPAKPHCRPTSNRPPSNKSHPGFKTGQVGIGHSMVPRRRLRKVSGQAQRRPGNKPKKISLFPVLPETTLGQNRKKRATSKLNLKSEK